MNPRRLLERLTQGHLQNVSFVDACRLAEAFGFVLSRTKGSHHIFVHPQLPELLNLQDIRGEAKPYQLRQMLGHVERYNLQLERDG